MRNVVACRLGQREGALLRRLRRKETNINIVRKLVLKRTKKHTNKVSLRKLCVLNKKEKEKENERKKDKNTKENEYIFICIYIYIYIYTHYSGASASR